MKKKILSAALVIALVAIMVGGTLAYFTDNDEVTNTFTIGSVLIEIFENNEETDSDTIEFQEPLIPVVKTTPSEDANYIYKAIKVKNTGANDAYIRTHLAIPTKLVEYLMLDLNKDGSWNQVGNPVITGDYTVYTYDYTSKVAPDTFTSDLLKGVYLNSDVDIKDNPATNSADLEFCKPDGNGGYTFSEFVAHSKVTDGYESAKVNVLVASQAIQAQGFENGATDALNTGFPKNPWQP